MHALEVIIAKNADAAGRAHAHAINDKEKTVARHIFDAQIFEEVHASRPDVAVLIGKHFDRGYNRARGVHNEG